MSDKSSKTNPPGFKLLHTLRGHKGIIYEIAWSQNGQILASCSEDKTIRLWSGLNGEFLNILEGHTEWVRSITFSPNNLTLASASDDGDIRLWNIATGKCNRTLTTQTGKVRVVEWSPDSNLLASSSYYKKAINIWNPVSWELENTFIGHNGSVLNLAWSPNSQILASVSDDLTVRLWNVSTGKLLETFTGHSNWIGGIAWSPDGKVLVSASRDQTIRIYDIETTTCTNIIQGHIDGVKSVSFSSDGRFLVSNSRDSTVRLWDCEDWSLVATLEEKSTPFRTGVTFHPSLPMLATLSEEDTVIRIWKLDYDLLVQKALSSSVLNYTNAKVVLLGESGVGKSGLGIRMAEKIFRKTKSTHGAQFWQIPLPKNTFSAKQLDGNIEAELTLWDLAGQADYHLIHQLFLDDTDAALLLFDCSDSINPFRGVPYWGKVLKKQVPASALKYLISARCDVSPVKLKIVKPLKNESKKENFRFPVSIVMLLC